LVGIQFLRISHAVTNTAKVPLVEAAVEIRLSRSVPRGDEYAE
jgi:hypothetical protein